MKNFIISAVTAAIVAALAVALVGGNQSVPSVQGVTNYDSVTITPTSFSEGLKVGTSTPTNVNNLIVAKGTCVLGTLGASSIDASQAASSTASYDCAITGVLPGDTVFATFATSTPSIVNGWSIQGAKASSTAGYVSILISNLTGTARVPSATGVGSSTNVMVIR